MIDRPAAVGPGVDISRPHPARMHNYWLGGKDNFAVDREAADAMSAALPQLPTTARAHRRFLERAARHLVAEAGVRQFVHLGCGLPTGDDLVEIARGFGLGLRVVFVDPDPVIAAHARALLAVDPAGGVRFLLGDAVDPLSILSHPELVEAVDLRLPVCVVLSTPLVNRTDDGLRALLDELADRLVPGSHVVLCHPSDEFVPAALQAVEIGRDNRFDNTLRTTAQVEALLTGWEVLEPGVVPVPEWRPGRAAPEPDRQQVPVLGAVLRRPATG
jgi:SAM-dependent methyltransferase